MHERSCTVSGRTFTITEREQQLIRSFGMPLPDSAPFVRWVQCIGQAMPFSFHHVNCPVTGKRMLSFIWSNRGNCGKP